jgi:nitronate monooxygenase
VAGLAALLGSRLPIVQAPMAGVQGGALAAAACEAGALGSLPCAMLSPEAMRAELDLIRSRTSRPFNVNFFVHQPPAPDAAREAQWRELLAPYYAEFGIDAAKVPAGPGRAPFSAELADALEPYRPAVVSFHFGLPAPDLLARVKSWGSKVLASATTVEEARWLESRGVDAVIAQGLEAGGHRGMFLGSDIASQLGTFALVPQVVAAVRVPVIAAGGIADARAVRAAIALGASGVQAGTAFLLCDEATTPAVNRAALRKTPHVTVLTNVFTGRPSRGIPNRIVREIGPISGRAPAFPLATAAIAPLRAKAEAAGSGDFSPLWSGQNATGCREAPAAEIVRALAEGLEAVA